jgi:hypothetical protein
VIANNNERPRKHAVSFMILHAPVKRVFNGRMRVSFDDQSNESTQFETDHARSIAGYRS